MISGLANCGKPPYAPTPSFDGPVEVAPTILQEIERLQNDADRMTQMAIGRIVELQVRLTGKTNIIEARIAEEQEGRRFPSDGQLGEAYARAFDLRKHLQALHREIDRLNSI